MKSVPLVGDRMPASAEGAIFWNELSRGRFGSPYDFNVEGFDFTKYLTLGRDALEAFEAVVRSLGVLLRHKRSFSYQAAHHCLMEIFQRAGWRVGDDRDLKHLRGAQVTRDAFIKENGLWEAFETYVSASKTGPALLEWHNRKWAAFHDSPIPYEAEFYGGSILTHPNIDESLLFSQWSHRPPNLELKIMFGAKLSAPARDFMRSEFVWKSSPLHYCSTSTRRERVVIQIDDRIQQRDGIGLFLDAFQADESAVKRSQEYDIPLFPVQFSFRHEARFF